ncbi:hypothetical protein D4764_20G0009900, partial [Takifugu flavidus]
DQLYTLSRVFEGAWEFAQPVHMCFVDLEKAFDRVPRGVLWGVLREYGVSGPLIRAVHSLYVRCQSLVHIAGNDVVLLASSACDLQRSLDRLAAACEAAGMKISTSKSEAMVLNRKKVECLLRVKEEILPQVEEFKYLGVLFTSEGRMEQDIDRRIGAASAVMRTLHWSIVVKRELSHKAKLLIYQSIFVPTLTYGHELWRLGEKLCIREELGVEPLLLHVERSQMRRPTGRPRTRWRDYVSRLAWECLGIPPDELEEVRRELERLNQRKAAGPEGISPRVLKNCSRQLCGILQHLFNQSLHLQRIFFAVVCWGAGIKAKDANRLSKLIKKAGSVVGCKLANLDEVVRDRMVLKLRTIMDNPSHPLHNTVDKLRSSFSNRLLQPHCSKEWYRKSFLPSTIRLYNSSKPSQ